MAKTGGIKNRRNNLRRCSVCDGVEGKHVPSCSSQLKTSASPETPTPRNVPSTETGDPFLRIAKVLDAVFDPDKGALRLFDVERGKVYATHLGKTLSGQGSEVHAGQDRIVLRGEAPNEMFGWEITQINCPCGIKSHNDWLNCSKRNSLTKCCEAVVTWEEKKPRLLAQEKATYE